MNAFIEAARTAIGRAHLSSKRLRQTSTSAVKSVAYSCTSILERSAIVFRSSDCRINEVER